MSARRTGVVAGLALVALVVACDGGGSDPSGGGGGETFQPPDFGDPMPASAVRDCQGDEVALLPWIAQHDVVYLTFGAKWCTACQKEAPIINADVVDRDYPGAVGVAQILVENDPGEAPPLSLCAEWKDTLEARFDILVDVDRSMVPQHFGSAVGTLPVHLIVTGDGVVRFRKVGEIPPDIGDRVADWLP